MEHGHSFKVQCGVALLSPAALDNLCTRRLVLGPLFDLEPEEGFSHAADTLRGLAITIVEGSTALVKGIDVLGALGLVVMSFLQAALDSTLVACRFSSRQAPDAEHVRHGESTADPP